MDLNNDSCHTVKATVRQWMVRDPHATLKTEFSGRFVHHSPLQFEADAVIAQVCVSIQGITSTARAWQSDSVSFSGAIDEIMCSSTPVITEHATIEMAVQRLLHTETTSLSVVDVQGRHVGTISVVDLLCATFAEPVFQSREPWERSCINAF